jgi:aminoglycoside phosphotransferase (APT) family kinase protein
MPQLTAGLFVDASLRVQPFDPDLDEWVARNEEPLGWRDADLEGLHAIASQAQTVLDDVGRVSLVHSDLNSKNILLDAETLGITGVLDWEFAHAGSPYADLGNLLRFDREPPYADAVLRGHTDLRGDDPAVALDRARCADLVALVDLAARKDANPVAARAHDRLLAIARTRDVHATD